MSIYRDNVAGIRVFMNDRKVIKATKKANGVYSKEEVRNIHHFSIEKPKKPVKKGEGCIDERIMPENTPNF